MTDLIIRVYSKSGRSRIELPVGASLADLKAAVEAKLRVSSAQQSFSKVDETGPKLGAKNDSAKLSALGVRNGDVLYLHAEAEIPTVQLNAKPVIVEEMPVLKSQNSTKEADVKSDSQYLRQCSHGPGQRCINCLVKEEAKRKEESKDGEPAKEDLSWMCNHPKGVTCIKCLKNNFVAGIKHVSFEHYMADRKAKCEHPPEATCLGCLPPAEFSYKLKPGCPKHKPYPQGVCNSCMPQTAVLTRQPYRHVDYVQLMCVPEITNFVRYWQESHHMQQRVGFLYGYYAEDPNYPEGVRAVVEAIYEPPQIGEMNGFQLLNDPDKELADYIAGALDLESIGWLFTTINHDAYLSSHEVQEAARLQQIHVVDHPAGCKVSKYVTVVLKPQDDGNSMPEAYMISDQGQALERDGVFGESDRRRRMVKRQAEA